eukprot:TRINITY_DN5696_c0_g1_i1.p1 TRINITY_DN5696_c0_g1~~TRINITY_DN5696_c0_g1_i1.p1  ORF type:complete len:121 (-),score=5.45 TRINITY_DN5696_c0_g1_i1:513-875(-)
MFFGHSTEHCPRRKKPTPLWRPIPSNLKPSSAKDDGQIRQHVADRANDSAVSCSESASHILTAEPTVLQQQAPVASAARPLAISRGVESCGGGNTYKCKPGRLSKPLRKAESLRNAPSSY